MRDSQDAETVGMERCWRRRYDAAVAVEQPGPGQVADRPLGVIALSEVLRAATQLAYEVRDGQVRWVERQDVRENNALVLQILRVI